MNMTAVVHASHHTSQHQPPYPSFAGFCFANPSHLSDDDNGAHNGTARGPVGTTHAAAASSSSAAANVVAPASASVFAQVAAVNAVQTGLINPSLAVHQRNAEGLAAAIRRLVPVLRAVLAQQLSLPELIMGVASSPGGGGAAADENDHPSHQPFAPHHTYYTGWGPLLVSEVAAARVACSSAIAQRVVALVVFRGFTATAAVGPGEGRPSSAAQSSVCGGGGPPNPQADALLAALLDTHHHSTSSGGTTATGDYFAGAFTAEAFALLLPTLARWLDCATARLCRPDARLGEEDGLAADEDGGHRNGGGPGPSSAGLWRRCAAAAVLLAEALPRFRGSLATLSSDERGGGSGGKAAVRAAVHGYLAACQRAVEAFAPCFEAIQASAFATSAALTTTSHGGATRNTKSDDDDAWFFVANAPAGRALPLQLQPSPLAHYTTPMGGKRADAPSLCSSSTAGGYALAGACAPAPQMVLLRLLQPTTLRDALAAIAVTLTQVRASQSV